MKLLRITKRNITKAEIETSSAFGLYTEVVRPSAMSPLTAMNVAKAIDKYAVSVVFAESQTDAFAALMARNLCKNKDYTVYIDIRPNSKPERHLHKDVVNQVDGWVFASQRLRDLYPMELKNEIVIQPASFLELDVKAPDMQSNPQTLAWIGDITNTQQLKDIIEEVDSLEEDVVLRISGAGKARDVMPAVRFARAAKHTERIVWVGEEYNLTEEVNKCIALVRSDLDQTDLETAIALTGRKILTIQEIKDFITDPSSIQDEPTSTPAIYLQTLTNYLTNN